MYVEHQRRDERRRLWTAQGPTSGRGQWTTRSPWTVREMRTPSSAKAVLGVVLEQAPADWPSDERWRELLPAWFLGRCRGGPAAPADAWPIQSFTLGFRHEDRGWWWFDATVDSAELIRVRVEIDGWPFGWGDVKWLFRAAGAARGVESTEEHFGG